MPSPRKKSALAAKAQAAIRGGRKVVRVKKLHQPHRYCRALPIYMIDVICWPSNRGEPEILSRRIFHAERPEQANEVAQGILKGIVFSGAQGVRVLNSGGAEIFSWTLVPAKDQ